MKQEETATNAAQKGAYRFAYGLYILLAIYLFAMGDYEWAVINFGIAMVFDPFDATIKWKDRPTYQKVWLYAHVALSLAGLLYLILK